MALRLDRLAVNWPQQAEMLRRYWDKLCLAIERLDALAGGSDGFSHMAGGAGPPGGTPEIINGFYPFYYDTVNNDLYVYDGSWKKVTLT